MRILQNTLTEFYTRLFTRYSTDQHPIYIVSGLPRSGTSMMMKMLEAGGLPVLTDGVRTADDDNPEGYYEFERVKKLRDGDNAWLPEACGRVVKVVSPLLEHLPPGYDYRIIFMRRDMDEVLASQRRMLIHRGEHTGRTDDEELAVLYHKHLQQVQVWLADHSHIDIEYRHVIDDPPSQVSLVAAFIGSQLKLQPMLTVVDPHLYRQRSAQISRGHET